VLENAAPVAVCSATPDAGSQRLAL